MTIQQIKENSNYRYAYIDFNPFEVFGHIYTDINSNKKYFIDKKETYFKQIKLP